MPPDQKSSPAGFRPKARRPRVRDRRGAVLRAERELVEKVSAVYEKWGFEPLDTSALEYADALGKFLPDQDRPNEGVFAFQDDDEQWLSLRYDLTAPLARFVAENFDQLPKPYRRWAAGPVWRNEKLGPGRFREFWQCDADTVGSASPAADAELIAMACEALGSIGAKAVIKISSRGLLDGILTASGVNDPIQRLAALRAIDKVDRLGWSGVEQLLGERRVDESGDVTIGARLPSPAIKSIMRLVRYGTETEARSGPRRQYLDKLGDATVSLGGETALSELAEIDRVLTNLGVPDIQAKFDISIVRGLEYYTGAVFEIELLGETKDEDGKPVRIGSVGAGGRYDDLVARFRGERIPATGISIGVSRLAAALNAQQADEAGPVVILALEGDRMAEYFAIARELRGAIGAPVEVYLGAGRFGAQLKYADKRGSPLAVIIGEDERKAGKVTIKNLVVGAEVSKGIASNDEWRKGRPAQATIDRADLIEEVRKELALLKSRRAS